MGKPRYIFTDSETEETSCSSIEISKKNNNFSILKYTNGNVKKEQCKIPSKSEPEDSNYYSRSRSNQRVRYKLKNSNIDKETSEEEEDSEPIKPRCQGKCLVGRVPRPAGAKPGRGSGVAIIVKKNVKSRQGQQSSAVGAKRRKYSKRLSKKRSY